MNHSRLKTLTLSFLCLASTSALVPMAQASPVLGNSTFDSNASEFWGQSFTLPAGSPEELTGVSFGLFQGTPVGKLYFYSQPYLGAGQVANAGTSLGSASYNSGAGYYDFSADNIVLEPGSKYYIYSDSTMNMKFSQANPYSGGEALYSTFGGSFQTLSSDDIVFNVQVGPVTPTPEPSVFALGLAGLAALWYAGRQRLALASK